MKHGRCKEDTTVPCLICDKLVCCNCIKYSDVHDGPVCEECKMKEMEITLRLLTKQFAYIERG